MAGEKNPAFALNFARALIRHKEYPEAEQVAERLAGTPALAAEVVELRALILKGTGKAEEGRRILEQTQRALRAIPGPDAWSQTLFKLADASSPTLISDEKDASALYVLMPMRV